MIKRLIRMDPGLDGLRTAAFMGIGLSLLLRTTAAGRDVVPLFSSETPTMWKALQGFISWVMLYGVMAGSKFWIRTPQFFMGLPLSSRDIWRSRVIAQMVGILFAVIVSTIGVSIRIGEGFRIAMEFRSWDAFLVFWGIGVWMLVAVLRIRPHARSLHMSASMITWIGFLWLCALALMIILPWNMLVGMILLGTAVTALLLMDRQLPACFNLEPLSLSPHNVAKSTDTQPRAPIAKAATAPTSFQITRPKEPSRKLLYWTVFRVLHVHWLGILFPIVLMVYGLALVDNYSEGDDNIFYATYTIAFLVGVLNQGLMRLHTLEAWPISRRVIYRICMLPGLVAVLIGAGLGLLIVDNDALIFNRPGCIDVPHEFKRLADDGIVPVTISPWGETYQPKGFPTWPGSPTVLYRPYEYGEDNSARFVAWLADEAVTEVHGISADHPKRMLDSDLEEEFEIPHREKRFPISLSKGRPSLERSQTVAVETMITILLAMIIQMIIFQASDASWVQQKRKAATWVGVGIPLVVIACLTLVQLTEWSQIWAVTAAPIAWLHVAVNNVGGSPALWWWGAAGVGVLAGLILQERFVRLEGSLEMLRKKKREEL